MARCYEYQIISLCIKLSAQSLLESLHQREEHTIILTLAATAWDPGIWRSKKINSRVIYCDALLAEDAGSQAVNGLLALKQHQLNGNGLDGRPGC